MTPNQERLFKIFHSYAAAQHEDVFRNGVRFVYYTTADTAVSILKNKQIWMRKSMCMNDFMEIQYGLQCISSVFQNQDFSVRFRSALDRLFDGLGADVGNLFTSFVPHLQGDTYLTCVSEHRQAEDKLGRLSMWRAYGGTSGVALVMNNAAFQAEAPSDVLKIYGSPVAYLDADKFSEEFSKVLTNIETERDFLQQQGIDEVKSRLFKMLAFAAVATKHPGFAEEREWRVIHCPWWADSAHLAKEVEVVRGSPQAVCKIPLKDIPEEGLTGITIPSLIDRIIIGPCQYPLSTFEAFVRLLGEAGVTEPQNKVVVSNIPLRQ
jgi:hypothetical protein